MDKDHPFKGTSAKLVVLAGALSLGLVACGDSGPAEEAEVVRPVKTIVVGGAGNGFRREFPGTVRASNRVDLAFQVQGPLTELNVIEGQEVERGFVIAQIDPRDFRSARNAAKARFDRAQGDFERDKTLYEQGHVAKARLDRTAAQRDIAQSELEQAAKRLNDATLRAPFDGVIARRYVENFQDVRQKEPIVSLQDVTNLEIVMNLPESIISQRSQSEPRANIWAKFDSAPDEELPLTIKEVAAEADPTTRTYEVTASFELPEGANILPGMTASVIGEVQDDGTSLTMSVPSSAIFGEPQGGTGVFVWIVDEATMQVDRRAVTVGPLSGGNIVVTSGLNLGDRVVTAGVHYLRSGQKVKVAALGNGN